MEDNVQEVVTEVGNALNKEFESIGLYGVRSDFSVASLPGTSPVAEDGSIDKDLLTEEVAEGRSLMILDLTLAIGDIAWTQRVLDPALEEIERSMDMEFYPESKALSKALEEEMNEGWEF